MNYVGNQTFNLAIRLTGVIYSPLFCEISIAENLDHHRRRGRTLLRLVRRAACSVTG
jgi:hypothetical protein